MQQRLKKDFNDLDLNNKPELKRQIEELVKETWLSPREAEISVLMNQTSKYDNLTELAKDLEISTGTIHTMSHDINQKIAKSQRTIKSVQKV